MAKIFFEQDERPGFLRVKKGTRDTGYIIHDTEEEKARVTKLHETEEQDIADQEARKAGFKDAADQKAQEAAAAKKK